MELVKPIVCMSIAILISGLALYAIVFCFLTSKRVILAAYRRIIKVVPEITRMVMDEFSLSEQINEEEGGEKD